MNIKGFYLNTLFSKKVDSSIPKVMKWKILRLALMYAQARYLKTVFFPFCLILCFLNQGMAQDIHFSQFYNSPLNINPALTGIYQGDVRFIANYRSQWVKVPVSYQTLSASADMKFLSKNFKKSFFAGGLLINYDQAGKSKLTAVNIGLTGSYTRQLSSKWYMTAGTQLSINQRYFAIDDLLFDRQWNGDVVDPTLPTGENFSSTTNLFFDFSAGLNFRWQESTNAELVNRLERRSKIDFGIALYHINQPDQSFYEEEEADLFVRISPYVFSKWQIAKEFDLIADATVQVQGTYSQFLGVLGLRYHSNRSLGKQTAVQLNAGYRRNWDLWDLAFTDSDNFDGSWVFGFELYRNEIHLGFSYDWNSTNFDIVNSSRNEGGWEISLRYIITKVKPLPIFKICPLI